MNKIFFNAYGKTNENVLIENIPEIIKSLLIDDIILMKDSCGNYLIDENSFITAIQKRNNWIGAFSLEKISSREIINLLCDYSDSIIIFDNMNRLKILTLDNIELFTEIEESDIMLDKDNLLDLTIRKENKYYNHFTINYKKDYYTGKYTKSEYIYPEKSSLNTNENTHNKYGSYTNICNYSFNLYGDKRELVINCELVRDRITAVNILKKIVERKSIKKDIVMFKSILTNKILKLEIGDQILLNISDLFLQDKFFIIYEINYDLLKSIAEIKAIQINI